MIKKIFATVLCCLLAGGAWAHDFSLTAASGQTLYFNILESAASVEVTYPNHDSYPVNGWGGYTRPVGNLRIPSSVVYNGVTYSVTTVGQLAFYGCTGLTSVVMGEGITVLGNSAFNGCTALTTAVVPSSIDTIGLRAFGECNQLAHVWCNKSTLPNASAYMFYNISLDGRTLHVPAQALSLYSAAAPWSGFGTILGDGCKRHEDSGLRHGRTACCGRNMAGCDGADEAFEGSDGGRLCRPRGRNGCREGDR